MRKFMFNDECRLTQAVIRKKKTKTRRLAERVVRQWEIAEELTGILGNPTKRKETLKEFALKACPIKVGEIVAVTQNYRDIIESEWLPTDKENEVIRMVEENHPGCTNKMFVKPELMARYIKITGEDFERLQDISDDDCLAEGIVKTPYPDKVGYPSGYAYEFPSFQYGGRRSVLYPTPRSAFAALIDKVSGKGTWARNPYVYVFTFELV